MFEDSIMLNDGTGAQMWFVMFRQRNTKAKVKKNQKQG